MKKSMNLQNRKEYIAQRNASVMSKIVKYSLETTTAMNRVGRKVEKINAKPVTEMTVKEITAMTRLLKRIQRHKRKNRKRNDILAKRLQG